MLIKNKHVREVAKGAYSSFLIKVFSAGITLLFYMYLGRTLGAESSGEFFLFLTVLTIASVVVRFGLENTILKLVAKYAPENNWGMVFSAYFRAMKYVVVISIVTSIIIYLAADVISMSLFSSYSMSSYIEIVAVSVAPLAISVVHAQALQGLKRIVDSTLILNLLIPLVALIGSMMVVNSYGLLGVVSAYSFSIYIVCIVSLILWWKNVHRIEHDDQEISNSELLASCVPLFWVSVIQMVINWFSYLVLGIFSTEADVGVFGIGVRVVTLFGFFLMAVNSISAPKIAAMHGKDNRVEIEKMCRSSSTLLLYVTLPLFVIVFFASNLVMSLFGEEFTGNNLVLQILLFGQFVNLVSGSVGVLLVMTGNEKIMRNNLIVTMFLCVASNLVLVPAYGLIGAAISFSLTMAFQNVFLVIKAKRAMNIYTLPYLNPLKVFKIA